MRDVVHRPMGHVMRRLAGDMVHRAMGQVVNPRMPAMGGDVADRMVRRRVHHVMRRHGGRVGQRRGGAREGERKGKAEHGQDLRAERAHGMKLQALQAGT